jgi:AcrR family transcriptional regulator
MKVFDRKRQPDVVRAALIQAAIDGALQYGLAGVTVQEIASLAGVTKGGLFHYFPCKQDLIDAAFCECLNEFSESINTLMQRDDIVHGRFTRAYITATIDTCISDNRAHAWFAFSTLTDKRQSAAWHSWMLTKLDEHNVERDSSMLQIARHAADGFWLKSIGTSVSKDDAASAILLKASLISLTMPR